MSEQAHPMFLALMPHPKFNAPPLHVSKLGVGEAAIMYFENPRTFGAVNGIGLYRYPQMAVVMADKRRPVAIVSVEDGGFGTMLCWIDAKGQHANYGPFAPTSRDAFLAKVRELINENARAFFAANQPPAPSAQAANQPAGPRSVMEHLSIVEVEELALTLLQAVRDARVTD